MGRDARPLRTGQARTGATRESVMYTVARRSSGVSLITERNALVTWRGEGRDLSG